MMIAGVLCQAVVVSLPTVSRFLDCFLHPTCDLRQLNHLTLVFALLILCAITFAGHMPESIWPGHFDVLGHGHQWFHVIVVLAMWTQVWAIDIDVSVMHAADELNNPGPVKLATSLLALVALETATFVYFMRGVVFRRLSKDIPRQLVAQGIRKHLRLNSKNASFAADDGTDHNGRFNDGGDVGEGESVPEAKEETGTRKKQKKHN